MSGASTMTGAKPPPLSLLTKVMFGVGSLAVGTKTVAYSALLLLFYNQVMGVDAGVVSAALLISLIIDAFTNPILGQFSDSFRSRWGRRHPFMYASAIPTAALFYLIFAPPVGWSDGAMFWWILVVATLARVAVNFYELPAAALTPEISDDYDERTSLMSWRYFFGYIGGLGTAFLAFKIFLQPTPDYPVGQLNPAGYQSLGLFGATLILLSILISTAGTHNRIPYLRQAEARTGSRPVSVHFREIWEALSHRGFLALLGFGVMKFTAGGMAGAMAVYFGTYVWQLSSDGLAVLTLDGILAAVFALLIGPRLARRWGKKAVAMTLSILAVTIGLLPLVLRQLGLFLPIEPEGQLVALLFCIQAVYSSCSATAQVMTSAMIADVVDDSAVKTGRHSAGVFFAASAFLQTCVGGLGVLLAGMVLKIADFPANAKPGQVAPGAIDALVTTYIPIVAALWVVGLLIFTRYRGTRETHQENIRRMAGEVPSPLASDLDPSEPDFTLAGRGRAAPATPAE